MLPHNGYAYVHAKWHLIPSNGFSRVRAVAGCQSRVSVSDLYRTLIKLPPITARPELTTVSAQALAFDTALFRHGLLVSRRPLRAVRAVCAQR